MINYFLNKDRLKEHAILITKRNEEQYTQYINDSIKHTILFDDNFKMEFNDDNFENKHKSEIILIKTNTVNTIFNTKIISDSERTCALNFASYKNPGGMFIEGSSAQEESLCHSSFLYNVLREMDLYYEYNNVHKNKGLYENRALYTPNVLFINNISKHSNPNVNDPIHQTRFVDVLTCAAPNAGTFLKYNKGEDARGANEIALANRVMFIGDIVEHVCNTLNLENMILGAWGCGVFRQDPVKVANLLIAQFTFSRLNKVIFAVPDDKTYDAFRCALAGRQFIEEKVGN